MQLLVSQEFDVDHVFVVDKSQKIVIDCVEEYPLALFEAELKASVVEESNLKAISEVLEFVFKQE